MDEGSEGYFRSMKGKGGLDMTPYFTPQKLKKTFAELKKDEKNNISHRGKALRKFKEILEKDITNG
ncbi:MAG: hypothetical protein CM1200mP1_11080 [Candidatus Neomarinimicrobiota bacterium]|nr:MAG: hypothetical protein CM1200mP1_11080 [Candidatus Neomarinimicrobiota bacterium]